MVSSVDANVFPVGRIQNPVGLRKRPLLAARSARITYPLRLNAMAIDPSRIVPRCDGVYTCGEVVFSTELALSLRIVCTEDARISVSGCLSDRASVIVHAVEIMRQTLSITNGFAIDVESTNLPRHIGLGSNGALQSAVAIGINRMFGDPIDKQSLVAFVAQNYGEEVDGRQDVLSSVQCIGGSAASGIIGGGILVLAGRSMRS